MGEWTLIVYTYMRGRLLVNVRQTELRLEM